MKNTLGGSSSLLEMDSDTKLVHEELEARLERFQLRGLVDIKGLSGNSSSTNDKLWTLNNVLRMYEEGNFSSTVIRSNTVTEVKRELAQKAYGRYVAYPNDGYLKAWYSAELDFARGQGLVDSKSTVNVNNHSNTHELLLTDANAFRLRRENALPTFSV